MKQEFILDNVCFVSSSQYGGWPLFDFLASGTQARQGGPWATEGGGGGGLVSVHCRSCDGQSTDVWELDLPTTVTTIQRRR